MKTQRLSHVLLIVALLAATGCERLATGPDNAPLPHRDHDVSVTEVTAGNLSPTAALLTLTVDDPAGDNTGSIDITRMQMDLDPTTGDYEIRLDVHPARQFVGAFRVNINLLNVDEDVQFTDAANDFDLSAGVPRLMLTGTSANLVGWSAGDEITTNSLCNTGPDPRFNCTTFSVPNPPGVSLSDPPSWRASSSWRTRTSSPSPTTLSERSSRCSHPSNASSASATTCFGSWTRRS